MDRHSELEDHTISRQCQCVNINIEDNIASKLPEEVIIHLMEFLSYSDRVAASQVCQRWYDASLHPKFINQEKVVIRTCTFTALPVFKSAFRPYYHFMLFEVEFNNKMKDFWLKVDSDMKSLHLTSCSIYEQLFTEMLSGCTNLESLVLENCRELFMSGRLLGNADDVAALRGSLRKLKDLNLSSNRYLSDAIFNKLVSTMPNLESISLENCQISYHAGLYKKYYPEKLTAENEDYASETVLTFWNFYNFLQKRAHTIKTINLSRTMVDSRSLSVVSELKQLELKELYIVRCEQLTNAGVLSVARLQPTLTVLDMSYCSRVTDQALLHICSHLTGLRKLAVRNCRAITDLGVIHLKNLVNIRELDISQCEQVTGQGIQEGLCCKQNRRLQKLAMEGLNTITSESIISLAESFPALTHLNLSYCFNAVTDSSVQAIFRHQVLLRSLRLAGCEALTDAGITGMGKGATVDDTEVEAAVEMVERMALSPPKLHISLRSKAEEEIIQDAYRKKAVQKMCEDQLTQSSNVGYSLARLRGLQELDLRCCNRITDVSLKYAFRFLELQHLNLSQCQQITDLGLGAIGEHNRSIDTLSLGRCFSITDGGILAVTAALHRLKYLDIKGCNQLTDTSVVAIVENSHQLRYLDASYCPKMADKIVALRHRLPMQTLFTRSEQAVTPPNPPPPPRH